MPDGIGDVAVLIPCLDEETTVGQVVAEFQRELPDARIFVYDNASTDRTAQVAAAAGATVVTEPRRGKGFVVERMLREIEADVYVLVDGDGTYSAEHVHRLLAPVLARQADMAVAARVAPPGSNAYRPMHRFGNRLVRSLVNWVGGTDLTDIMSGYRAFNAHVARQLPMVSRGFEIETDLTIQAVFYRLHVVEIQAPYGARPAGSESKLRTTRDGARVLWHIFTLLRSTKPLTFFGGAGIVLLFAGLAAGSLPVRDYLTRPDHFVSHVPLAILAMGLVLMSFGSVLTGVVLHAINWRLLELHNVLTRPVATRKRA